MKKRIRLQGFLVFSALPLSVLLSKFLFPAWKGEVMDEALDILGIGMVLFGFLFRISARGYKAERSREGEFLITEGPYAFVRHPMYFGTLLIGLGTIAILLNEWALPPFLIVFLLIYVPQIHREQRQLMGKFGQVYRAYCERTPAYFPRLSFLSRLDLRESLPLKASWFKKEWVSLVGVFGVIIVLEIWQDVHFFGRAEFLKELKEFLSTGLVYLVILFFLYRVGTMRMFIREGRPAGRRRDE